jgi:hypothetical protein
MTTAPKPPRIPVAAFQQIAGFICLGALCVLASCAKIIGADFSDLLPYAPEAGAGGSAGQSELDGDVIPDGAAGVIPDGAADAVNDRAADVRDMEAAADARVIDDASAVDDAHDSAAADSAKADSAKPDGARPDGGPADGSADAREADVVVDVASDLTVADTSIADAAAEAEVDASADGDAASDELPMGRVVINELNATGALDDYIELYNAGEGSAVLDGFSVAQAQQSFGSPNLASRLTFGPGTVLGPGERLLIVANQSTPGGPFAPCTAPQFSVASCYTVSWGISRDGERIYLLAPGGPVVSDSADYPTTPAPTARAWGRVPDGTAAWQWIPYSPGTANAIP